LRIILQRFALIVLLLGAVSHARAAGLQIVPVLVELSPTDPRASVIVRNVVDAPVRLELSVLAWDETRDGKMRFAPAPEFVVFPPILEIPARSERKVRISTTATFGAREQTFRLFVQELAPPEKPKEKAAIQFLTRIGIPVFLAPTKSELKAEFTEPVISAGHLKFLLKNTGTTRLSPGEIRIEGRLADDRPAFTDKVDSWYVLAGGERAFDFTIPPAECSRVSRIVIEAPLGDGKVTARVETPGGACGP
jgi:fimbrial chaperone protein